MFLILGFVLAADERLRDAAEKRRRLWLDTTPTHSDTRYPSAEPGDAGSVPFVSRTDHRTPGGQLLLN